LSSVSNAKGVLENFKIALNRKRRGQNFLRKYGLGDFCKEIYDVRMSGFHHHSVERYRPNIGQIKYIRTQALTWVFGSGPSRSE
jgi:hypothetical protein